MNSACFGPAWGTNWGLFQIRALPMRLSICRSIRAFFLPADWRILSVAMTGLFALASASAQVGTLDPDFGNAGVVVVDTANQDILNDVVITPTGRIFAVGRVTPGGINSQNALLSRLEPDGQSLLTWSLQATGLTVPDDLQGVAVASDGNLISFGWSQYGGGANDRDFWVRGNTQNGGPIGGSFQRPNEGFARRFEGYSGMIQNDGKFVTVGSALRLGDASSFDAVMARWLANGDMDTDFGVEAVVRLDLGAGFHRLSGVDQQADGKLVVSGYTEIGGQRDILLARFNADGSLDGSFGSSGLVTLDFSGFNDQAQSLIVLPGGRIAATGVRGLGKTDREFVVMRFLADGTLDSSFGIAGVAAPDFGTQPSVGSGLVRMSADRLLVTGWTETGAGGPATRRIAVARLLPNGDPDPKFNATGMTIVDTGSGLEERGAAIALQPDGGIVIAGNRFEDDSSNGLLIRLLSEPDQVFADRFDQFGGSN
jgi:uncharacterized delta-60 repeat protein